MAFENFKNLATRLIAKNGSPMTLRTFGTQTPPDPARRWEGGASTVVDVEANMVLFMNMRKYSTGRAMPKSSVGMCMISAQDIAPVVPKLKDRIITPDGLEYVIEDMEFTQPNGVDYVHFELALKR